MQRSLHKGFTLIELLIVIAIIAVLAAALIPALFEARVRAEETGLKGYLRDVYSAAELYYLDNNGVYPTTLTALQTMPYELRSVPRYNVSVTASGTNFCTEGSVRGRIFRVSSTGLDAGSCP